MQIKDIQDPDLLELLRLALDSTLNIQIGLKEALDGSSTNEEVIQKWLSKLAEVRDQTIGVMANLEAIQEKKAQEKLNWITRLYEGYFNTDQNTALFAPEFYSAIGEILSGKKLNELKLEYLILEEIL